jgi:hypothetical protein
VVTAAPSIRLGARVRRAARRRMLADPRAALRVLLVALVGWAVVSLLFPEPASAGVSEAVQEAIQDSLSWVFETIMWGIFGRINAKITQDLISWLVAIPNFNPSSSGANAWSYERFVAGHAQSSIDRARLATSMIALGGLGAVMTLSVIRYWLSGLTMRGSGGMEAFEGFSRSLFAVGLIIIWPDAFRVVVALVNSGTHTLVTWPSTGDNLSMLLGEVNLVRSMLGLNGPVGLIVTVLIYVGMALMILMLVVMKIFLTAGTSVLYVLMPLAIVLWPLPETSWVANVTARAWVVCMLVPLVWAVVFVTFAAVGADYFTLSGQGLLLDRLIIKPLVTVAMLWLAILLPRALAKAALMGAISSATGANVQSLGSIRSAVAPLTAPLAMARGAQGMLNTASSLTKTASQFSSGQKAAASGGASPGNAAKAGLMSVLGVPSGGGGGGGDGDAGQGSGAGSKGSSKMSGDLHRDAGGWSDAHGRRTGMEPPRSEPKPPRAADHAPLSEGADAPAPQPQLGDDHVPKPGHVDTLRWHANRVRSGTSSAVPTGDDVVRSARLNADYPALASIKTDPGSGGASVAMSSLTPTDRQQVAHQTQSSAVSDQQWESAMLTRATNPGYTPAEQEAWFSFAAAGRPAVQQAIDVGAHEAEGDWGSGPGAAHGPAAQQSSSSSSASAPSSPTPRPAPSPRPRPASSSTPQAPPPPPTPQRSSSFFSDGSPPPPEPPFDPLENE